MERLLGACDRETPFGRRDHALFTVMMATGLHLSEALVLRLKDLAPSPEGEAICQAEGPAFGQTAAWEAARAYLEAGGRLAGMGPDDYVFTPLQDVAGAMAKRHPLDWERQPLHSNTVQKAFKTYVRWAELDEDRVTPETLRYTGARRLLEAGVEAEAVARFLRIQTMEVARQVAKRLQGKPGEVPAAGPLDEGGQPNSLRRRRPGAQPGNKNSMKHGVYSERFRLSRLGIRWRKFHLLRDADLPRIIIDLNVMLWDLLDLPEDSLMPAVKKLKKAGYMVFIRGLLKAHLMRRRRQTGIDLDE